MGKTEIILAEPQEGIEKVVDEAEQLLRKDPFSAAIVLPSPAACRMVEEVLMARDLVLLGNPITNIKDFAKSISNDCAIKETLIDTQQAELIISNIMEEHRSELVAYHSAWSGLPSIVSELRALFDTWREFEVAEEVQSDQTQSPEAVLIFKKYIEVLKRSDLLDQITSTQAAIRWLEEGKGNVPSRIWALGLNEMPPLEMRLAKAILSRSEQATFIIRKEKGNVFSEGLSWISGDQLKEVQKLPLLNHDARLHAERFPDPLSESRAVASKVRHLIGEGVSPGKICIVLPMREKSAEL